jgi:phosphoserine phosphatase
MASVLTLIAASGENRLDAAVAAARIALAERRATLDATTVLAPGIACDVCFAGPAPADAAAAVRASLVAVLGSHRIDLVAQPVAGRRKQLLVADMESTIIENEMLDELADFLGLRDEVAEITRRAMNNEIDFVEALETRVGLLAGLPATRLDEAAERIRIMPGAAALVATMRREGALTALVSGGFRCFTARVRAALGFDRDVANTLEIEGGHLTGHFGRPIVTRETKLAMLEQLTLERGLERSQTLAVGDGANDLKMIEASGLGIAFRAKPAVAAQAPHRIDHADLTALLYVQGYRADEIVTS